MFIILGYIVFKSLVLHLTVSEKVDHQLMGITLSKPNRFSKFFHCWREE